MQIQKPVATVIRRTLLAIGVLSILWMLLLSSAGAHQTLGRTYYWLDAKWEASWPFASGRYALSRLVPLLMRFGILQKDFVEVEPGMTMFLDPRDFEARRLIETGAYQDHVWLSLVKRSTEGSVVIDVGAHFGVFTIKAAKKVGNTGRVVAIDPNPEILKLLRVNIAASNVDNVTVVPVACTARDEILTFYASPLANTGESSLARENATVPLASAPREYQVRGMALDNIVRELGLKRVDAVKIDVEGAELEVLKGAQRTLEQFHPLIVVEIGPEKEVPFHAKPDDVVSLLKQAGYGPGSHLADEDWEFTPTPPEIPSSGPRAAMPAGKAK